jgi:hypothetical protein
METESDNATQRRNDEFKTTARAAPQYGAAIVGNRLASLQRDSGHHRQAHNEAGGNTEPRLLANRLQRLVFRVRPVSSGE